MTKVSVVVINKAKKEEFLKECLDSICSQSLEDIEIIVANDNLSESDLKLCRKYSKSDKRIRIVDLSNIDEKCDAIIDTVKGKYITFVDFNDFVHKEMFKNMYTLAENNNVDMVKSAWYKCYGDISTKDISLAPFNDSETVDPKYTLFPSFAQINEDFWSAIYRTDYLKENNIKYFNSKNVFRAIGFYFKALALTDRIIITPNAYYFRRQNRKDPSSYSLKTAMSIFSVYEDIDNVLEQHPRVKALVNNSKIRTQFKIYEYIGRMINKKSKYKYTKKLINIVKEYVKKGDIDEKKLTSRNMNTFKSLLFYDYILSLTKDFEIEKKRIAPSKDKIPVILSADDNYSCFVATTGTSVLYHTNSFIEFYILSEGITDENERKIEASLRLVSNNFSIKFIECDAKKYFSDIKLPKEDYVKVNTCNRLLFPYYVPDVDRAIYLDVDLIVMDDIRKLWDIDIKGHVFGACPLYVERLASISGYKYKLSIPDEHTHYHYLNSGILLIDYKKWRELKNGNQGIIEDIFNLLETIYTDCTPDELLLNKFAYNNGGYYELPHKFNVQSYYSFNYLKNNKDKLDCRELWTLKEYRLHAKKYDYKEEVNKFDGIPAIRHFYGSDKPWNSVSQWAFPIPMIPQFFDFWYYASKTLYFEEIQAKFVEGILSKDRY